MKKYDLKMTLTSDMLPGSGIGHGAAIDSDACFDEWGFPMIPGKRIKGMLREAGEEAAQLEDKNCIAENLINLFGTAEEPGALQVRTAYLEGYPALKAFAEGEGRCYSVSDISSAYAYLRSQTAVDAEYGKAKDESLRTIRVLRKGLVFVAEIELLDDTLEDTLFACADNFWSLGTMRSRGLGRIRTCIHEQKQSSGGDKSKEGTEIDTVRLSDARGLQGAEACLSYCFTLQSPVIATNRTGGDTSPQIPGSTLRGCLIAAWLRKKGHKGGRISNDHSDYGEFKDLFLEGDVCYGPGTITDSQGNEYQPLPANILEYKNKQESGVAYADTAVHGTTELTKSPKQMYIRAVQSSEDKSDKNLQHFEYQTVTMETAYHMSTQGDGDLYQYTALQAGQRFRAQVYGSENNLRVLEALLNNHPKMTIGRSRTAQYGEAVVDAVRVERINKEQERFFVKDEQGEFLATLISPAWLLDQEAGAPVCDAPAFRDALAEALGMEKKKVKLQAAFLRFCTLGGYNPMWRLAKPAAHCLDAGASIKIKVEGEKVEGKIQLPAFIRIGENAAEGLGLVKLEGYSCKQQGVSLQQAATEAVNTPQHATASSKNETQSEAVIQLKTHLSRKAIFDRASEDALKYPLASTGINPTTVHALIDAFKTAKKPEDLLNGILTIKDTTKRRKVANMLFNCTVKENFTIKNAADVLAKSYYKMWPSIKTKCNHTIDSEDSDVSEWELMRHWQLVRLNALKQKIRGGR